MNKYLSTNEASKLFGVTPDAIRKMLRDGKIKGVHIGRKWFIREEDIERMFESSFSGEDGNNEK